MKVSIFNRVFLHDIMAAILVFQNNEMAAILVFQTHEMAAILIFQTDEAVAILVFQNNETVAILVFRKPIMEGRLCWCSKQILWELNSFLVAPCKGIQESLGFCIPRHCFRIPGTRLRAPYHISR